MKHNTFSILAVAIILVVGGLVNSLSARADRRIWSAAGVPHGGDAPAGIPIGVSPGDLTPLRKKCETY